jgi:hypothetical protein
MSKIPECENATAPDQPVIPSMPSEGDQTGNQTIPAGNHTGNSTNSTFNASAFMNYIDTAGEGENKTNATTDGNGSSG